MTTRFRFDYSDHRVGTEQPASESVECRDLDHAEHESMRALCHDASNATDAHAATSITIRDEGGKPLSVASVHATVKRL